MFSYRRLLAFPKGLNKPYHFSLYLTVADSEFLPLGWRRHAKFSLTVVNQFSDNLSEVKGDLFLDDSFNKAE